MSHPTLRPQPEDYLSRLLAEAKKNPPPVKWDLADIHRRVRALGSVEYDGRVYVQGEEFICTRNAALSFDHLGLAEVIPGGGGRLDRGSCQVFYPQRKQTQVLPLYRPWDEIDSGSKTVVRLDYSDLFLRCAVRNFSETTSQRFDLSALIAQPGYEFFTSFAWVRKLGFCLGPSSFAEPLWGASDASLHLFWPQVPA